MLSSKLKINDIYWTVQGEGLWSGRRALFVRLPFCNYDCPWCDTEYNTFNESTMDEFLKIARKESSRFAVLTGGEPLANAQVSVITKALKQEGFFIACETNGSRPPIPEIDFYTVSPKAYTKKLLPEYYVHPSLEKAVGEYKFIVDNNFDFSALSLINEQQKRSNAHYSSSQNQSNQTKYYLSPEYSQMKMNTQKILQYIQYNPHWQLSLQTHKWINIP